MSVLLIVTTGRTDVQLRQGNERLEFDKDTCGTLHDQLAKRTDWSLAKEPLHKGDGGSIMNLPEGPFELCTPKLDAVLTYAGEENIRIAHALVLDTRRDSSKEPEDPNQAGAVLARRLHEALGVDAVTAPYLVDAERLKDTRNSRDAVVRRDVVSRIDVACRNAIDRAKPNRIVLAATGGFKEITSLVEEIVALRAGEASLLLLDAADARKGDGPRIDRAVPRDPVASPNASFEARRRALESIRGGRVLGAWSVVKHLHQDSEERRWTRVVSWLYHWACSLPLPEECDIGILKHRLRAVWSALQVEFALRAGDIPRAIHCTVGCFESALWDHLDPKLKRHPTRERLFSVSPVPDISLISNDSIPEDEKRKRPFELKIDEAKEGGPWYKLHDDNMGSVVLAKGYLHKPRLEALGKAVAKIRDLRNDVAHNAPTPEKMERAEKEMQKANLWSSDNHFLCQPLVIDTLEELGEINPRRLAEDLVSVIERRLLDSAAFLEK